MPPSSGFSGPPAAVRRGGIVLVVDDDNDVRHGLLRCLQGTEFRGVGAASGAEAIRAIQRSHPQAVLLDWVLPGGIDGLAVLKALKAGPSTSDIPVIMLSGIKRRQSEKLAAQRAGAEGLYAKLDVMVERESLLGLLRAAVAKNKALSTHRLLVIEDDPELQDFIRLALARRACEVHASSTGRKQRCAKSHSCAQRNDSARMEFGTMP